jgi:hypothetical protein
VLRVALTQVRFKGFTGRAVELGTIPSTGMWLALEGVEIEDCGKTSDTNYRAGIEFNSLNTISYLRIAACRIANVASTYMQRSVAGNATVTEGQIVDNDVVGTFSAAFGWTNDNGPVVKHRGTGVPALRGKAGSTFQRTDGGAGSSFYVKESGTGTTWAAK